LRNAGGCLLDEIGETFDGVGLAGETRRSSGGREPVGMKNEFGEVAGELVGGHVTLFYGPAATGGRQDPGVGLLILVKGVG
jgi:hypothetical protein